MSPEPAPASLAAATALESPAPEIAVIVSAYRRREYLRTAVGSVLAQSSGRDRIEILVLKDFTDPELDAWLAKNGIRCRLDAEPRIGRWLLGGLAETRAPIVAFLDDDDVLEPERIERVLEVFRTRPWLSYYRNRLSIIDERGRAVPRGLWSRLDVEAALERTGPIEILPDQKEAGIARLRSMGSEWLNVSTMAFRREIFTERLRPAVAQCHCQDLFTFVCGAASSGGLFLDDRRLTRYRRHPTNASRTLDWKRLHCADHSRLAIAIAQGGPRSLEAWLLARARLLGNVVEAGEALEPIRSALPRRPAGLRAERYVRSMLSRPILDPPALLRWGAALLAAAYQLSPSLARPALRRLDRAFDLP